MVYQGTVINGKVVLDDPTVLPNGVQVIVTVREPKDAAEPDDCFVVATSSKPDSRRCCGSRATAPNRHFTHQHLKRLHHSS